MTDSTVDPIIADEERYGDTQREAEGTLELEAVDPIDGELVDLKALGTDNLAEALARVDDWLAGPVGSFRDAVKAEIVRRLDNMAERKARVGDFELETNAPTSVDYRDDVLKAELEALVEAGEFPRELVDKVFPTPAPPPPPGPKLSKRELNKLKADPRVAPAIAKASVRVNNTRTLKVTRKEAPDA